MPRTSSEIWAEFERRKQTEPLTPDTPVIAECITCSGEIREGDIVYRNHDNGDLYCNRDCFRVDVKTHVNDFVDFLESEGYAGDTIAVKD